MNIYKDKYLKYKMKYLKLKEQLGNGISDDELVNFSKEIYEIQDALESYFGKIVYLTGSAAVVLLAKKCDKEGQGVHVSSEDYPIPSDADFLLDMTEDKKLRNGGYNNKTLVVEGKEYKRDDDGFISSGTFKYSGSDRVIKDFDLTKDFVRNYHTYDIGDGKLIKILDVNAILDNYLDNSGGEKEEKDKLKRNVLIVIKDCESIKIVRESKPSRLSSSIRSRSLFGDIGDLPEPKMTLDFEEDIGAGAAASGTGSALNFESPVRQFGVPRTIGRFGTPPSIGRAIDFSFDSPVGGIKRSSDSPNPDSEKKKRDE